MRRRKFIALLGSTAISWSTAGRAQKSNKIYHVGFLVAAGARIGSSPLLNAFVQKLQELGYAEGRNLVIHWRYADGDYERLPSLAAELVGMKVDVIVTNNLPGTLAAKRATTTIPIVFNGFTDPVGTGVVNSLARPEGNITGLSIMFPELVPKQVELLASIFPKLSRIAVLVNFQSQTHKQVLTNAQAAAEKIGASVLHLEARSPEEIDRAFTKMADWAAQALIVASDPYLFGQRIQIAQLAIKRRVPTIAFFAEEAEAGLLSSFGQDRTENYRQTAVYVEKILKGVKPSDLPIEQPTVFPFVINLKTAKTLGVKIPQTLLMRADRVIE